MARIHFQAHVCHIWRSLVLVLMLVPAFQEPTKFAPESHAHAVQVSSEITLFNSRGYNYRADVGAGGAGYGYVLPDDESEWRRRDDGGDET